MAELAWPDLATASNAVGEGSGAEMLVSEGAERVSVGIGESGVSSGLAY
jgi:hypothetical protein